MRLPLRHGLIVAAVVAPLLVAGCSSGPTENAGSERECISGFDPDTDYFPEKSTIEDATGLSIEYHESYQVVTVDQPAPGAEPASYVLVRCGAPAPELDGALADAPQIQVPVSSVYAGSTTHLPALAALGAANTVTGVSTTDYVSTPQIRELIDAGKVKQYADAGVPNVETVIAGQPDVLVTDGMDSPAYGKLEQAGVPVIADADWLEASPLGRAEWIKFFAALTGTEKQASQVYDGVKKRYQDVVAKTSQGPATDALLGGIENGAWTMPAGGSYFGRLVHDAGGTYPWSKDMSTGSLRLSIETVIDRARDADAWLLSDMTVDSIAALRKQDPRYAVFARPAGNAWNATKAMSAGGGNDYWERGVLRPDQVLTDLAAILHPDRFADHRFEFYQRLPAR